MAGPAFNAAYAGVVTPVAYSSVAGNTKLANGMKFYLKAGWTTQSRMDYTWCCICNR